MIDNVSLSSSINLYRTLHGNVCFNSTITPLFLSLCLSLSFSLSISLYLSLHLRLSLSLSLSLILSLSSSLSHPLSHFLSYFLLPFLSLIFRRMGTEEDFKSILLLRLEKEKLSKKKKNYSKDRHLDN